MHSVIDILIVEDNPADSDLLIEVLSDSEVIESKTHVACDGVEAMSYLKHCIGVESINSSLAEEPIDSYEQEQFHKPDLIFLDLNLPKMNGRDVLREIKKNEKLLTIPVLVLTSSKAKEDIELCYKLHANAYISKPVDFHSLVKLVHGIEAFWFSQVCYPKSVNL